MGHLHTAAVVDRGEALMDTMSPDWWRRVDVLALDVGNNDWCILGQTFGSFTEGLDEVIGEIDPDYPGYPGNHPARYIIAADHGFDERGTDDAGIAYADLTDEWRRRIVERRRAS